MWRPTAWLVKKRPLRLTAIIASQSSSRTSNASWFAPSPALLTRMSIRPWAATAESTAARMPGTSVTSSCSASTRPPSGAVQETSTSGSRTPTRTSAPLAASALATSRPIPRPAPVTRATCPVRSKSGLSMTPSYVSLQRDCAPWLRQSTEATLRRAAREADGYGAEPRAGAALDDGYSVLQGPDCSEPATAGDKLCAGPDFWGHRTGRPGAGSQALRGLCDRHSQDGLLTRRSPTPIDGVDVAQQHQPVGIDRTGEHHRGKILIDAGLYALEPTLGQMRDAPAARRRVLAGRGFIVNWADRLGGVGEGRVVGRHHRPGHDHCYLPVPAALKKGVVQGLSEQIPDLALRLRPEYVERRRRHDRRGHLCPNGEEPHLGTVAVSNDNFRTAALGERDEATGRRDQIAALNLGRPRLAASDHGIAAEGDDQPSHPARSTRSSQVMSVYRSACSVSQRFSASSQTRDCGPSMTSSVTSSPRWAGRQWRKMARVDASDISSASTL